MSNPGKPKLIRKINRALLIQEIRAKQLLTNSDLIKSTGLSRRTINLILSSLEEKEIVQRDGFGESTKEGGKRPVIYKFNPDAFFTIGVIVRERFMGVGVSNLNGEIICSEFIKISWDDDNVEVINHMITNIKSIIEKSKKPINKFLGVGIGLPGLIDYKEGTVKLITRHVKWKDMKLVEMLQNELSLKVLIDNENLVRTLGEKWFGMAKGVENFVTLMTTINGIGCGVVIKNEIYRSINSLGGEIGQIKLNFPGRKIKDFLDYEEIIGEKNINEIIIKNKSNKLFEESDLKRIYLENNKVELFELFESFNKRDKFSKIIIEEISEYFVLLIIIIICTYDPELIIIHGVFSLLEDSYFENIKEIVENSLFPQIDKKFVIKRSLKTKEMGILGAASMVFDIVPI